MVFWRKKKALELRAGDVAVNPPPQKREDRNEKRIERLRQIVDRLEQTGQGETARCFSFKNELNYRVALSTLRHFRD